MVGHIAHPPLGSRSFSHLNLDIKLDAQEASDAMIHSGVLLLLSRNVVLPPVLFARLDVATKQSRPAQEANGKVANPPS